MRDEGLGPILHSTSARFRRPVTYPDHVQVGARVTGIQPDRITLEFKLVSEKLNASRATLTDPKDIMVFAQAYSILGQHRDAILGAIRYGHVWDWRTRRINDNAFKPLRKLGFFENYELSNCVCRSRSKDEIVTKSGDFTQNPCPKA